MTFRWQTAFLDLHRQVDELFEKLVFRPWAISVPVSWRPPLDIHETADAFIVLIDLPGVPPEEVRLLVSEQVLVIAGERHILPVEGSLGSRCERVGGSFERVLELPAPVDRDRAEAAWRHGTFCIQLPRLHPASWAPGPGEASPERHSRWRVVPVTAADRPSGKQS